MTIVDRILGPESKYNKSIPYTYEARVDELSGTPGAPEYSYYYSDTICGLIEFLDKKGIAPEDVQLKGVYQKKEISLEIRHCVDKKGNWLKRPHICHSLEKVYKDTLQERYKGHVEKGECLFEDRDRKGSAI